MAAQGFTLQVFQIASDLREWVWVLFCLLQGCACNVCVDGLSPTITAYAAPGCPFRVTGHLLLHFGVKVTSLQWPKACPRPPGQNPADDIDEERNKDKISTNLCGWTSSISNSRLWQCNSWSPKEFSADTPPAPHLPPPGRPPPLLGDPHPPGIFNRTNPPLLAPRTPLPLSRARKQKVSKRQPSNL